MSSQLLDRIKTPVRKSLSDAGVKAREIDEVVLVGGTTKMPLVRKVCRQIIWQSTGYKH